MSDIISIQAQKRTETGRNAVRKMKKNGIIPAVVYGHGIDSLSLSVPLLLMEKAYERAGESSLIELRLGDEQTQTVVIHGVQRDPLKNSISHVDFHQVRMDEKMTAEVEIIFDGIAPAVKEMGGTLVKNISHIEVECLPKDLPHNITIDISVLKTFNDSIRVKDISIPVGVTVLLGEENTIASVDAPRTEEELKSLNEVVVEDVSAVEMAEQKEKKEEEEGVDETKPKTT